MYIRFVEGEVAEQFFQAVLEQARTKQLLSDEHFSVDGTLLEAWASDKSFQKKSDPPKTGTGSRGETLLNDTHGSITDPESPSIVSPEAARSSWCTLVMC